MDTEFRIFKRKLYDKMLNWKRTKDGKSALLIKGARRVGKSTIAEEFAKKEYTSYIIVDFANVRWWRTPSSLPTSPSTRTWCPSTAVHLS